MLIEGICSQRTNVAAAVALIEKAAVVLTDPAGISSSPQTYSKHTQTGTCCCYTRIGWKPTQEKSGGSASLFAVCYLTELTENNTDQCSFSAPCSFRILVLSERPDNGDKC